MASAAPSSSRNEDVTPARPNSTQDDPIQNLLRTHIVPNAQHDSIIPPYPTISPGTREDVLHTLTRMLTTPVIPHPRGHPGRESILWFTGPSGSGKTSILVELSRRCHHRNALLASFLFSPRSTGHIPVNSIRSKFVVTLAYQIALTVPGLWEFVAKAVQDKPRIFEAESARDQALCLIFRPLEELHRYARRRSVWWRRMKSWVGMGSVIPKKDQQCLDFNKLLADWGSRNTVIVDGLDEYEDAGTQAFIVGFIVWISRRKTFPLRFVLSSCNSANGRTIRKTFSRAGDACLDVALDEYPAPRDIATYLRHEFARIRKEHPLAHNSIPIDVNIEWPTREIADTLVLKSRELFIYASTIVKVIEDPTCDPVVSLDWVMSISPENDTPPPSYEQSYAQLDALYASIFHPLNADLGVLRRLLNSIMLSERSFNSPSDLDEHLSLRAGSAAIALQDLHSVIHVPSSESSESSKGGDIIRFHHSSAREFLASKERSGDMFQTPPIGAPKLLQPGDPIPPRSSLERALE